MRNETTVAAAVLVLIGIMNVNEEAKRGFDFDGILQTWAPLIVGGYLLFRLFR